MRRRKPSTKLYYPATLKKWGLVGKFFGRKVILNFVSENNGKKNRLRIFSVSLCNTGYNIILVFHVGVHLPVRMRVLQGSLDYSYYVLMTYLRH